MNFTDAIKSGFSNYVGFSGRAPRSAYWYWVLFVVLASIGCRHQRRLWPVSFRSPSCCRVSRWVPAACTTSAKAGWWQLLGLIPLLGWAVLHLLGGAARAKATTIGSTALRPEGWRSDLLGRLAR